MVTNEIEELEEDKLPWVQEIQGNAREAAAAYIHQDCLLSLPVPAAQLDGRSRVAVFFFPFSISDRGGRYVFEPVVSVTIDAAKMEALEVKRLRDAVDVGTQPALSLDRNEAARNMPLRDWDSLNFEFFALYEEVLDAYPRDDLDENERKRLRRFAELFCFVTPAGLLLFYEKLSPAFFSWLKSITGRSLAPIQSPPLRPAEEDIEDAAGLSAAQLPQASKIELTDQTIEGILDELKLNPSFFSPLADLQPRENRMGLSPLLYQFPDWAPENWRRVFQTLCNPEWEIALVFSNQGFAAKTNLFDGDDPDRAYWIRCTQQISDDDAAERKASRLISFPHDPEGVKKSVLSGLQSVGVDIADQNVQTLSPFEFMTVLGLADLCANGSALDPAKMAEPFTASDLIKIWFAAEESRQLGWCATGRIVCPVMLPNPEDSIPKGLESLKSQEFIKEDGESFRATPKLRALIRSLRRPTSFVSLQLNHYGNETFTTQGFSGIRTDDQIWLWEAADTTELKEHSENISLNLFQVTNQQLVTILDCFLGTGSRSE